MLTECSFHFTPLEEKGDRLLNTIDLSSTNRGQTGSISKLGVAFGATTHYAILCNEVTK